MPYLRIEPVIDGLKSALSMTQPSNPLQASNTNEPLQSSVWKERERNLKKEGFREGAIQGRDDSFQTGFDMGYSVGYKIGEKIGLARGIAGYTQQADHVTSDLSTSDDPILKSPLKDTCYYCTKEVQEITPDKELACSPNIDSIKSEQEAMNRKVFERLKSIVSNIGSEPL